MLIPACDLLHCLGGPPRSPEADRFLLAIAGQESAWHHRAQVLASGRKGPARGFWQFEMRGGVYGVLKHRLTAEPAAALVAARGHDDELHAIWRALEDDDVLAAGFARLLLWTLPAALPTNAAEGWRQYLAAWRPGKPHPDRWPANWQAAVEVVAEIAQEEE
ncbi:hypothetical protein CKO22_02085 [Thiococcus pfennigii]|nr:hypothetical protein [Thiococcus pfennigii]